MEFIDYYKILELSFGASSSEIKLAYKTQAVKWHPDKNPGMDTTLRMQQINEAYLMLKDPEGRERYNREYQRYKEYQRQAFNNQEQQKQRNKQQENAKENQHKRSEPFTETFEDDTYEVFDETLNKWMSNARKQAVDLAKRTIEDIIGMSKESGKAMTDAAISGIIRFIVFGIIIAIIFATCR
jgi:curved DNA-binding protein CbpA